jgi:hypothetical protein
MTCEQVAEAEASWAARRAGTAPQYLDLDVEIVTVPEPAGRLPMLAAVAGLVVLGRRRRIESLHGSYVAAGSAL